MPDQTDITIYIIGSDPLTAVLRTSDDQKIREAVATFGKLGCNHHDLKTGIVTFYPPHRIDKIAWVLPNAPITMVGGIEYILKADDKGN